MISIAILLNVIVKNEKITYIEANIKLIKTIQFNF